LIFLQKVVRRKHNYRVGNIKIFIMWVPIIIVWGAGGLLGYAIYKYVKSQGSRSNALYSEDLEILIDCRNQCANNNDIGSDAYNDCVGRCYARKKARHKN
jgi:hypothetical protein